MVWSGVTKCLINQVQIQKKAIEIRDFAIFGPIFEKGQAPRNPNDKGVRLSQTLDRSKINPVFVVLNEDFLTASDWNVSIDQNTEKAVGKFSKFDRAEVNALFNNRVQQLGISSIASVCFTDTNTVELILQEILATIVNLGK